MTNARELANLVGGTLTNLTSGTSNVALGDEALEAVTSGANNTGIGVNAGTAITTGSGNTALGHRAGEAITTADNNVFIGKEAGLVNTTGASNVAVGRDALVSNTTASDGTAVGFQTLYSNTTGGQNTAVGRKAMYTNTTGDNNAAVGFNAMFYNTTGADCAAFGTNALQANTTGNFNVAVGRQSLVANTTAAQNTVVGYRAGYTNQTGGYNTFIGYKAGYTSNNSGNALNTCVGYQAGYSLTTGSQNCFVGQSEPNNGYGAGHFVTTGTKNTILGGYNGNQNNLDIRTSSNNIVLSDGDGNIGLYIEDVDGYARTRIGANPQTTYNDVALKVERDTSNHVAAIQTYVNSSTNRNAIIFGNSNSSNVGSVQTNGSSTSFITSSDYRLKENVVDLTGATDRLKQLKPKRFNFITDADTTVDGFLAHEAATVVPEAVSGTKDAVEVWKEHETLPDGVSVGDNKLDDDGNTIIVPQGIDQAKLVPLLVATIKELEARITALENA